ncbi:MGH1-like glycoside hydrolase domain-containing protein [Pinirhizobacter sp.]|jgi:glycogen debranching enzyme|uniref:MGH1-like glycoside hydrolase domain-containing protein n=1 Tax=Pinirhizobacter sp. TaxID=2950432 RepID=UPI002F4168CB
MILGNRLIRNGCLALALVSAAALAQDDPASRLAIHSDATGHERFLAVHGQRALIQGLNGGGLEVFAFPFQIVGGLQAAFRHEGSVSLVDSANLLRGIDYAPDGITRTYVGTDYVVRETLFVPRDAAAAVVTYSVESPHPLDIVVSFNPVLDLMWPGSIGGQSVKWDEKASAYVLFEPSMRYGAFVGSPDVDAHDKPTNNALESNGGRQLRLSLRAGGKGGHDARLAFGMLESGNADAGAAVRSVLSSLPAAQAEQHRHVDEVLDGGIRIHTPDDEVNSMLSWAAIALDQAWACNPQLGCGFLAGFGPSREARRAQYEWYFAGDGLIANDAMIATGRYARAREELEFILKHRDQKTGMIWHEMSQSAGLIDWSRYPYMFVHVDISFQFLSAVDRYVRASGDVRFVTENYDALAQAYAYGAGLVGSGGYPRIPPGKEGHNEQDKLGDELSLSIAWQHAAESFAHLATLAGHAEDAARARTAAERARAGVLKRYWVNGAWIDAYTPEGKPVHAHGAEAMSLIDLHVLSPEQENGILDQLATADFQTDWGMRNIPKSTPGADPNSYANGSVWAVHTAHVATAYWAAHRPWTASAMFDALVAWNRLDSPGHIHELAAGDIWHQQVESVPEQTWSSSGVLTMAVDGLLGLSFPAGQAVSFSPHLPAAWDDVGADNIPVPGGKLGIRMSRTAKGFAFDIGNSGSPIPIALSPQLPLGAHLLGATVEGRAVQASVTSHGEESHASLDVDAVKGNTHVELTFEGGVDIGVPRVVPVPGDTSKGAKIIKIHLAASVLTIQADVTDSPVSTIRIRAHGIIPTADGADVRRVTADSFDITPKMSGRSGYRHINLVVRLAPGG